ncbi:MAG: AraC family transcriptional regulator [Oscillospiraceae bacterium]|nr:AraC family transcriptional regulator [Oscillospiraceae bacterium]
MSDGTLERLNHVTDYIETRLDGDIDYDEIARIACCSLYHFQRMFGFVSGIPLGEYIRRRRLTAAAFDLRDRGEKVLDTAVKYGYSSADAFARAFHALHGVKPSMVRGGVQLKAYPRLIFTITIKGVEAMNYRIEQRDAFTAAGVKRTFTTVNGENLKKIPQMWEDLQEEGLLGKTAELSDREPSGLLGICDNMRGDEFDYWIAAATTKPCPEGMDALEIPACTWAVFEAVGPMPGAIQELYGRIFGEWFPASGYEHAHAPEIEWYSDGDTGAADYRSEVWMPVVKKQS